MDRSDEEIIKDIKSVLEKNVKDNVSMHGGMINFLSYDNGTVRLEMAGACSGCAMSAYTLQQGIEGIMMSMVPEVKSIVGVDDPNSGVDPFMSHNYGYDPQNYWDTDKNDDIIAKDE